MKNNLYKIVSAFAGSCLLLSVTATAQTATPAEDPIDAAYHACIGTDTSCSKVSDCAFIAYGKWNKEMEDAFDHLLKQVRVEDEKTTLRTAQTAWLSYRDATFLTYDLLFDKDGPKWCRIRHDDRIDIVRTRAQQLKSYSEALKKKRKIL